MKQPEMSSAYLWPVLNTPESLTPVPLQSQHPELGAPGVTCPLPVNYFSIFMVLLRIDNRSLVSLWLSNQASLVIKCGARSFPPSNPPNAVKSYRHTLAHPAFGATAVKFKGIHSGMKSHLTWFSVWMDSVMPKFRLYGIKLTIGELEVELGCIFNVVLFLILTNRQMQTHTWTHACIYTHMYKYTDTHVYLHTYSQAHICTLTGTYMHMSINTV